MPRFFVNSDQVRNGSATLVGEDAAHLVRSLRVRPGELVVVVEAGLIEHGVRVAEVTPSRVEGRIAWSRPVTGEPSTVVHVLQALPAKGMELAVEALSEVGAAAIHPVITSRTVTRPDSDRGDRRVERWRAIARESAQLAGRARAPEVDEIRTLADALGVVPKNAQLIACALDRLSIPLRDVSVPPTTPAVIAIGPEGGFDGADLRSLHAAGASDVHLGGRVLPAWLAGAVAVSLLLARSGDMESPPTPPPA